MPPADPLPTLGRAPALPRLRPPDPPRLPLPAAGPASCLPPPVPPPAASPAFRLPPPVPSRLRLPAPPCLQPPAAPPGGRRPSAPPHGRRSGRDRPEEGRDLPEEGGGEICSVRRRRAVAAGARDPLGGEGVERDLLGRGRGKWKVKEEGRSGLSMTRGEEDGRVDREL